MDNVIKGIVVIIKRITTCPLTRYHLAGIFLLLIMQRNNEIEPTEYVREMYFKLRYAPIPTKLLTWPIRMALCFLLTLPNVPDFPLGLIVCEQYVFPYVFTMEVVSCLLLGLHVTNYCSKNANKCFYTNDEPVLQYGDFHAVFMNALIQVFITTHIMNLMWLCKSLIHVTQRFAREVYKWFMRHVKPKVIPVCRVAVLMFVFNLQDAIVPVLCIYVTCKIFMDHWLLPLIDSPFTFPNEANDTNNSNARSNDNDDGNSSELSDDFEDIPTEYQHTVAA